jgi:tyrosinase
MTVQTRVSGQEVQGTVHHRKSVDKLEPQQLADLRQAFKATMALTDERGFWYFAGWHGEPFNWCEHGTDLFLPWHRAYLYYFELALQTQVPGVTLPWWDWTVSDRLPKAYADDKVGGEENPLLPRVVRIYRSDQSQKVPPREPGAEVGPKLPPLPYKERWDQAMEAPSFTEFQTLIEAIHNDVHVWVGGIMRNIQWAAYDPIFYAHHVMIDRAWRIWQHNHAGALPPDPLLDRALRPNGMTVRQTLHVRRLGYDYAGTTAHAAGPTS